MPSNQDFVSTACNHLPGLHMFVTSVPSVSQGTSYLAAHKQENQSINDKGSVTNAPADANGSSTA